MIIINDIVNSKDKMLELAEMASQDSDNFINFEVIFIFIKKFCYMF